jgi:hypothetical protein
MPKLFLLLFIFFCAVQSEAGNVRQKINWIVSISDSCYTTGLALDADGAVFPEKEGLPYWHTSIEVNGLSPVVVVQDASYEPVVAPSAILKKMVGTELKYWSETGTSAGKTYLRLSVLPFIRNGDQWERLIAFTLSIDEPQTKLKSAAAAYSWKSASVLGSGTWIKIKTKNRGIYKITTDQLKQWGFSAPDLVSLFGTGGLTLPVMNRDTNFDDLLPYPVWKGKDGDGKDCIFFYSTGNIRFSIDQATGAMSHQQNPYATETYFYLTDSQPVKTIDKAAPLSVDADRTVSSFPNYVFSEKEERNLIASGSRWFGERFIPNGSVAINFALDHPELTKSARLDVSAVARSNEASSMSIILGGVSLGSLSFSGVNTSDQTSDFANDQTNNFTTTLPSKNVQLKLVYNSSNSSSEAWLDYAAINYMSQLTMSSDVFFFRGKGQDGQANVTAFVLSGASSATKIMDVTDIQNAVEMPAAFAGGQLLFKSNSPVYREYVAFNPGGTIPVPDFVGAVANQNLHASAIPDMIIVSSPTLIGQASVLADYHRNTDAMTVDVVTPQLIYNEFSGGLPDPAGIRNYFRMYYDRGQQGGGKTLKYVLLMGDGSFDNRDINQHHFNLIPTYQSDNSLSPVESFVTDDFYAFLDENEGGLSGIIDIGIGRIPANNVADAQSVVDKIKNYHGKDSMGNWRNVLTFIADDKDNRTHMFQAENLTNYVNQTYPAFFTDKIYLDAFKLISTPGGQRYPDVNAAINNRVRQGTLVMNYTGHANEKYLADEDVLDISAINSWTNIYRLPIFVTATCEFSRFDGDETSAGEYILFNPIGGGVGLFSTTRLVWSGANSVLNMKFFKYIFENDQTGNRLRLGDVMRLAKADANTGTNQLNFTLLADPAMRLANPNLQVKTSRVDGVDVETVADTIKTLTVVKVKGYIADPNGIKLTSFNGEIVPTVYDKAMQVETLGNAGETPMNYTVQNNVIFKGLATVTNGEFEFSFFVPKDISYKVGKGKILYYAYNDKLDAQGYFDNFFIGGSSDASLSDVNGPQIDLFLNSGSFKDGGRVSASSVLLANISDQTGINTSGTGIGHDITAVLDGDYSATMVLNDYFQYDKDSFTSGKITFPLNGLSEGEHVLIVKVWDVLNNSSEKEIHFFVKDDFRIESINCYPNPMNEATHIVFTHNQPDEKMDVTLEVFNSAGAQMDRIQTSVASRGNETLPLEWRPAGHNVRMVPGIYVYRVTATTNNKTTSASGRLVYVYR